MADNIKEQLEVFHDKNVHIQSRSILLTGEVCLEMFTEFFKNFHVLNQSTGTITIFINSEGGDLDQCKAIYDLIKASGNHIVGTVYGEASSSASLILQACDTRTMSKSSYLMIHIGEEATGGHPSNKKAWDAKFAKDTEWMLNTYLVRIKQKKPRYTKAKLTELLKFDTILSTEDAAALGLIDKGE
jgi:ATP-dependent Clp protease protease subunit